MTDTKPNEADAMLQDSKLSPPIVPQLQNQYSITLVGILRSAAQALLLSIIFGMCLPFSDVVTDVRLSVRLYRYGHPKWAMSVLGPVILSTLFTMFACREIERKKEKAPWLVYIPLVLLQVYPQFCICRLIFQLLRKEIPLEKFISARDGLDGGVGCIEPYCESVIQVYIQTAIFAFVRNIDPVLTSLCYTEKEQSCSVYDICGTLSQCLEGGDGSDQGCHGLEDQPYVGGYIEHKQITNCTELRKSCISTFEECIVNFKTCIETCKYNLTNQIIYLDQDDLYQAVNNDELLNKHILVQDFSATQEDLEAIQMYLLVIGNHGLFISTYIISIIAAAYGITKFFRLGHARLVVRLSSPGFISIAFISTAYMILKAMVLAGIIIGRQTPITYSMLWWLLFTMFPTTILVAISSLGIPCRKMKNKFGKIPWRYLSNMIMKQPSILLAPHITPYMFTIEKLYILEKSPARMINGKWTKKNLDCYGSYVYSEGYTLLNVVFTMTGSVGLICWKGHWISNGWEIFGSIIVAILIFIFGLLLHIGTEDYRERRRRCPEHDLYDCYDCLQVYGFFVEKYKEVEACEEHENKKPYEFQVGTSNCKSCKEIDKR